MAKDAANHMIDVVDEILLSAEKSGAIEPRKKEYSPESGVVDIITFCESPKFLNLPGNNFNLFLSQRVVLKTFYMGTIGNESMSLTKEEWQWLYDKKQDKVIEKLKKREAGAKFRFSELTLVLGRRSSKTVLSSVIASYEAYKLLVMHGGDPYGYFQIPNEHKIAIVNVATSRDQSKILFSEIESRISNSPFFANRVPPGGGTSTEIKLFTDLDLKKKAEGKKVSGSVSVLCGHSNPKSLRGYAVFCLIFDELAFYDEGGKISAKDFYNALQPSVMEFATSAIDGTSHGVVVEISSTGPTTGYFYKLWSDSLKEDHMLSFKCATWEFNPKMPQDHPEFLRLKTRDPESFAIEFGAEWPEGAMFGQYFPKELIERCYRLSSEQNIQVQERPNFTNGEYYFHIDPGLTASRYVLVAVQKRIYRDSKGIPNPRSVVAFIKIFTPVTAQGLEWNKIDQEVLDLCRLFRPIKVTYDQWNSASSLSLLQQNGINIEQISFNRSFKCKIFQNLRDLMSKPECGVYVIQDEEMFNELVSLKFRPSPRGISIGADKRGECPTDDIADCLAGATFSACGQHLGGRLPSSMTVYTGYR